MMVIEHIFLVILAVFIPFIIVFTAAVSVQLIDADHWCSGAGIVDNVKLLIKGAKATSLEDFPDECRCLHRGVFHNVWFVYIELFLALLLLGFAIGHGIHMMADGYDLLSVFR